MLSHKIGLITADELTVAGSGWDGYDSTVYLYTGQYTFSASPRFFADDAAREFTWTSNLSSQKTDDAHGLRPLVSLKNNTKLISGTGLQTDPYIVE
jgi:hypothetical protein